MKLPMLAPFKHTSYFDAKHSWNHVSLLTQWQSAFLLRSQLEILTPNVTLLGGNHSTYTPPQHIGISWLLNGTRESFLILFPLYKTTIRKVYSPEERALKNPNHAAEGLGLLCEAGGQFCYWLCCVRAVPTDLKSVERLKWGLKGTCTKSWHRVYTIWRLAWKGRVTKSSKPKPI